MVRQNLAAGEIYLLLHSGDPFRHVCYLVWNQQGKYTGAKSRGNYRGGLRYTPINMISSLNNKKIVYKT